jgi:hypothetical protein
MCCGSDRVDAMARRRQYVGLTCIIAMSLTAGIGRAQPVFSEQDLDTAMKAAGRHIGLAHTAIAAGDFEAAKIRVARVREQLFPTVAFWRNNKETEAVKLLREAVAALDALDGPLSREPIDRAAVVAAATAVDAACQRCHAIYRDQDPKSKAFMLKLRR